VNATSGMFSAAMASIPDDIKRFVLTSVPSVPHLEAALFLRKHAPRECTAAEVAAALYVGLRLARELLEWLCAAGLAQAAGADEGQVDAAYHYAPRDPSLAHLMDRLAVCYSTDLVGVSGLIHDAIQRSARSFADAFKLRKDS